MWFAISPMMPTLKKPICVAPDSEICKTCALKFPTDNMKSSGVLEDDPQAPKGAKDANCKVCYPYEGRAKGRAGCGGLGLTDEQVKISTLIGISGTFMLRVVLGSAAEKFGIRFCYAWLLILCSIPGFALAGSTDYMCVYAFRFFVGWAGGSFVLTSMWTTQFFDGDNPLHFFHPHFSCALKPGTPIRDAPPLTFFESTVNVVGIASGTAAGWGNLGGGIALVLNAAVFQAFKNGGWTNEGAWRGALAWPPAALVLMGVLTYLFSDDNPYGNFAEQKRRAAAKAKEEGAQLVNVGKEGEKTKPGSTSFTDALTDWRSWILFLSYGASLGVELVVYGNIVTYFSENFGMTQSQAGSAGAAMGLVNIFARAWGGWTSDFFAARWSVKARLWAFFFAHAIMASLLIIFSRLTPDNSSIGGMMALFIIWACFEGATNGTHFAMLPYINPTCVGGVAGIVGAGGNFGALIGNVMIGFVFSTPAQVKPSRNLTFLALGWYGISCTLMIPLL